MNASRENRIHTHTHIYIANDFSECARTVLREFAFTSDKGRIDSERVTSFLFVQRMIAVAKLAAAAARLLWLADVCFRFYIRCHLYTAKISFDCDAADARGVYIALADEISMGVFLLMVCSFSVAVGSREGANAYIHIITWRVFTHQVIYLFVHFFLRRVGKTREKIHV